MKKRIAIVGAGVSGLTAVKCCLDENLEPICFEKLQDIGGLWNYTEESVDGQSSVMRSTVANTSKSTMGFSDCPVPKEYPIFMHHTYVQKYLNFYADKFNLKHYIRFMTEVLEVKRSKTFNDDGKWEIKVKDRTTGKEEKNVYDGLMICVGHHAQRYIPHFTGLDMFRGKVLHSNAYKDQKGYDGKRVVIIGIGNSAVDAAVELGPVASKVYLSTRRGTWLLKRVTKGAIPLDMTLSRAFMQLLRRLPLSFASTLVEKLLNENVNHELFCLKPKHRALSQHPLTNDDLPHKIISGMVTIKTNVKEFTETGVKFEDGTFEDNIDVVILATGYGFRFPFLEEGILCEHEHRLELYKHVFQPNLAKQTLAMIGYVQVLGAIHPLSELQSRLATRVFKGDVTLPSKEVMWRDIRERQEYVHKRYLKTQRHSMLVEFLWYLDELAELVGCKPDIKKLLLSDPKLAYKVLFGPPIPTQYRLMGHGKWDGAKEAIETSWERALYPLQTRQTPPVGIRERGQSVALFIFITISVVIIFTFLL